MDVTLLRHDTDKQKEFERTNTDYALAQKTAQAKSDAMSKQLAGLEAIVSKLKK